VEVRVGLETGYVERGGITGAKGPQSLKIGNVQLRALTLHRICGLHLKCLWKCRLAGLTILSGFHINPLCGFLSADKTPFGRANKLLETFNLLSSDVCGWRKRRQYGILISKKSRQLRVDVFVIVRYLSDRPSIGGM
jgi:hypothetical protein